MLQTLEKGYQNGQPVSMHSGIRSSAMRRIAAVVCWSCSSTPISSVLVAELEVAAQPDEWGMNGSGMLILNAPWQLDTQLADLLPRLCQRMGSERRGPVAPGVVGKA